MIKIANQNLDKFVNEHYENLKGKFKDFPKNSKYSLREILTAKPKKLDEIANWFMVLNSIEKEKYDFIKQLYKNFTNKKKRNYNAYDLAKKLNVNTCIYCNINPTYTVITKNDNKITRPEFDHFHDKKNYPILALSFYNLIPSCHVCNSTLKGTAQFSIKTHIHPYIENFNKLANFKLKITNSKFYYDEDGFNIKLQPKNKNDKKTQNTIDAFKLNILYQNHKDIVLETIQKQIVYNDSYIEELMRNYEGTLFKNEGDLMRLISCGYGSEEDIGKRPLLKLIGDISKELDFA